jgi:hypothetical protein
LNVGLFPKGKTIKPWNIMEGKLKLKYQT